MSTSRNFTHDSRFSSITDGGYSNTDSHAEGSDYNNREMGSEDELFFVTSYSDFEKLGEWSHDPKLSSLPLLHNSLLYLVCSSWS
jgi:hypothetical protein